MANRPSNNRGSNSAAVTNLTEKLKAVLEERDDADAPTNLEKANLLTSLAETYEFFDDVEKEESCEDSPPHEASSDSSGHALQAIDRYLMVDHLASGFLSAFEDAFGTDRSQHSDFVGYMMEKLETGGVIEELMQDFPVTPEDMARLGRMEGGDEAYESLPPATVGFICESLLSEADTAESKVVATRKITALVELFARVHRQVGRRGPSTETIVDLNWALKQLVILTEVHLRGETLESDWPMEAETDDKMPTGKARATAEGKALLEALGELPSD